MNDYKCQLCKHEWSFPPARCPNCQGRIMDSPDQPPRHRLAQLVDECRESMEAFDRTVCTGPVVRGGIQPVTPEERRAITRNALDTRRAYAEKAEALGFTRRDWEDALRHREMR